MATLTAGRRARDYGWAYDGVAAGACRMYAVKASIGCATEPSHRRGRPFFSSANCVSIRLGTNDRYGIRSSLIMVRAA